MGDTANEHSISRSNQKEALSMEIECTASRIGDNFINLQLEAVLLNGICTMEMVKFLVVMVSKSSSEMQQPIIGNEVLEMWLRDLQ
jgi:hypothetical protein